MLLVFSSQLNFQAKHLCFVAFFLSFSLNQNLSFSLNQFSVHFYNNSVLLCQRPLPRGSHPAKDTHRAVSQRCMHSDHSPK